MADYICPECKYTGTPRYRKRGSKSFETAMWMVFPFGLPYTFWRMLTKTRECRHCGNTMLVKTTSPLGQHMLAVEQAELMKIANTPRQSATLAPAPLPAPLPPPKPLVDAPKRTVNPDEW